MAIDSRVERPIAEKLLAVAGEIFAAKGRAATVREICFVAKCSVAAINYYFGDKNQLYIRCIEAACETKQRLFPLPTAQAEQAESNEERLRMYLRVISRRMTTNTELSWQSTLLLREILEPSEGIEEQLKRFMKKDFELLQDLVMKLATEFGVPSGRCEGEIMQLLAQLLFMKTGRGLLRIFELPNQFESNPEAYADEICDSLILRFAGEKFLRQKDQATT